MLGRVVMFAGSVRVFSELSESLKVKGVSLSRTTGTETRLMRPWRTMKNIWGGVDLTREDDEGSNIPSYPGEDQRISSMFTDTTKRGEVGPLLSTRFNSWFPGGASGKLPGPAISTGSCGPGLRWIDNRPNLAT